MDAEIQREQAFTIKGVKFSSNWKEETADIVVLGKNATDANYAVRVYDTQAGSGLELLTKEVGEKGVIEWLPSKTPFTGNPEKVIREAEYRQSRINKNWTLDTSTGVLLQKGGIFAAKKVVDETGRSTGLLELHTLQGPKGAQEWFPAKNACIGSPEQVFRVAATRQWHMNELDALRRYPQSYIKGTDSEGGTIYKHSAMHHAVRIHSIAEKNKSAQLEILTTQYNEKTKKYEWMPAKTPFVGTPTEVYAEIRNREYGISKTLEAKSQGMAVGGTQKDANNGNEMKTDKVRQNVASTKVKGSQKKTRSF